MTLMRSNGRSQMTFMGSNILSEITALVMTENNSQIRYNAENLATTPEKNRDLPTLDSTLL